MKTQHDLFVAKQYHCSLFSIPHNPSHAARAESRAAFYSPPTIQEESMQTIRTLTLATCLALSLSVAHAGGSVSVGDIKVDGNDAGGHVQVGDIAVNGNDSGDGSVHVGTNKATASETSADNSTGSDDDELNFVNQDLNGADFSGRHLKGANITNTHLEGANLTNSDLREANIVNVDLSHARLNQANLRGANVVNVILDGADLSGATWTDGRICKAGSTGRCR